MNMNNELRKLKAKDAYSLILFILYKLKEEPEYSTLSELAYILDKDALLNICQYYGGMTIKIPALSDISHVLTALLLYQEVYVEGKEFEKVMDNINLRMNEKNQILDIYQRVVDIMSNYSIS